MSVSSIVRGAGVWRVRCVKSRHNPSGIRKTMRKSSANSDIDQFNHRDLQSTYSAVSHGMNERDAPVTDCFAKKHEREEHARFAK